MPGSSMTYSLKGRLTLSRTGWVLLEVPNSIGNGLFQALSEPGIEQPISQTHGRYNAHVSVIRPEEVELAGGPDAIKARGQTFGFNLGSVREITNPGGWAEVSKCWVIEVRSPELMTLRRSLGLGEPKYPFHMTFAIRKKHALKTASSLIHFQKLAAVSTEIKESPIEGRGLFATRNFKIGDVIVDKYMTKSVGEDGRNKFDQSEQCRYTNHSSTANCVIAPDGDYIKLVADRDIVSGEELTGDYASCGRILGPDFDFTYRGKPYDGSSSTRSEERNAHRPVSETILQTLRRAEDDQPSGAADGETEGGPAAGDRDAPTAAADSGVGEETVLQHSSSGLVGWGGDHSTDQSTDHQDQAGPVRGGESTELHSGVSRLATHQHADSSDARHPRDSGGQRDSGRTGEAVSDPRGGTDARHPRESRGDAGLDQGREGSDSRDQVKHAAGVLQRDPGSASRDSGTSDSWFRSWAERVLLGYDSAGRDKSAGAGCSRGTLSGDDTTGRSQTTNGNIPVHGTRLAGTTTTSSRVHPAGSGDHGLEQDREGGLPVNYADRLRALRLRRGECPGCGEPFQEGEPYPDVEMCEVCERFGKPKLIKEGMALIAQIAQARKDTAEPASEAQAAAGNYAKGKFRMHGLSFAIETPKGGVRSGKDKNGKAWSNTMTADYGYILGTVGSDEDHVDVFIGPDPEAEMVFVVDQVDPSTGKFDEIKVMFGYKTEEAAREGYLSNYSTGWQGLKEITPLTMRQFKWWLNNGDTLKPVAGATIKTAVDSIYGKALQQTPVQYNPQAGILGNVTNHLSAVKARGDRTIAEAGAQDRLANAMDPNRASQQLLSLIQGKRQPLVQHPIDRILAGELA